MPKPRLKNNSALISALTAAALLLYLMYLNPDLKNSDIKEEIKSVHDTQTTHKVLRVIDGDTVEVEDIGTIRLIGMDTPETVDPRKPVQCFGKEASKKTTELLLGKSVTLEYDLSQDRTDRYGRTLAYIHTTQGVFFNLEMIAQGYAFEYTYSTPYKYQKEFLEAEKSAREKGSGLWGDICEYNQTQ